MTKKFNKIEEIIIKELTHTLIKTPSHLDSFKRRIAKKYKITCPTNVELLRTYHKMAENKRIKLSQNLLNLLRTRPIRSLSGIVNVSVLTKPYPCPGKCIYCPTERGIPKSYLKEEPAVQRAILNKFHPFLQVQTRLESLVKTGHPIDKIELRIIGGTWSFYPKNYQSWFITRCFAACNAELRGTKRRITRKIKSLKREQRLNEKAKHRVVGLSIETRPDFINEREIKWLRKLGVTMIELGVQSIYDNVLKLNLRGHGVKETILATKLLKDAGFKVLYQIMLNLPGSTLKKDEKMFEEIFKNSDFKPDLLKIYPLALVKNSALYKWYLKGKYKPYSDKKLIKLLIEIKKKIPCWVRIQRIVRDIPSRKIITGGAKISNLREIVQKEMAKKRLKCKCIRCREVKGNYPPSVKASTSANALVDKSADKVIQNLKLFRENYEASDGKEIFLSFENKKREKLYALLRLRLPCQNYQSQPFKNKLWKVLPVLKDSAIIREVHTYGQMLPVGKKSLSPQHRGLGKRLIKEAEKIVKRESNLKKIAVISGVGVRKYYSSKLNYNLRETYMIKVL